MRGIYTYSVVRSNFSHGFILYHYPMFFFFRLLCDLICCLINFMSLDIHLLF